MNESLHVIATDAIWLLLASAVFAQGQPATFNVAREEWGKPFAEPWQCVSSTSAANCASPTQWTGDFRVVCQKVSADFVDLNKAVFTFGGENSSEYYWKTGKRSESKYIAGDIDCYLAEGQNFIDAVRGKCKPAIPAQQGLDSLILVDAAARSAKAGGKIIKPDFQDHFN